jgi:antitoxin (DNA-binding transcriptional repressor) of toxin-antitoxin stability system
MATVDSADLISITDANRKGISSLARDAEAGREQVLLRNNRPVAAIVSMRRLEELQQLEEDLLDVTLVAARMLTTAPARHSLDEILSQFGYSRDELRELT